MPKKCPSSGLVATLTISPTRDKRKTPFAKIFSPCRETVIQLASHPYSTIQKKNCKEKLFSCEKERIATGVAHLRNDISIHIGCHSERNVGIRKYQTKRTTNGRPYYISILFFVGAIINRPLYIRAARHTFFIIYYLFFFIYYLKNKTCRPIGWQVDLFLAKSHIRAGVVVYSVFNNLKMEVVAGGVAGGAHLSYNCTLSHGFTL